MGRESLCRWLGKAKRVAKHDLWFFRFSLGFPSSWRVGTRVRFYVSIIQIDTSKQKFSLTCTTWRFMTRKSEICSKLEADWNWRGAVGVCVTWSFSLPVPSNKAVNPHWRLTNSWNLRYGRFNGMLHHHLITRQPEIFNNKMFQSSSAQSLSKSFRFKVAFVMKKPLNLCLPHQC